jgi:hypothetical protein
MRRNSAHLLVVSAVLLAPGLVLAGGAPEPETQAFEDALKKKLAPAKKAKKGGVAADSPYSDGDAGGRLGTAAMRRANKMASEILERRMREQRAGDLKLLREAGAADVIVVRGSYDRVQDVLRAVQAKHVVVPPHLVEQLPLMSTQTLMVNCPGNLSRAGIAKVRHFVKTGGYLVTTDWALTLLSAALPGYVVRAGRNTGNDVVSVRVHSNDDPTLKHVKTMSHPRWWLESSSYPIRVLDRQRVKVLISSSEMKRKYGEAPIAVSFRHDDGKVLHMTSHFYLQQAKLLAKHEKQAGGAFARAAGLSEKEVAALKDKGIDGVRAGELSSAYSMQQVTANVLVAKQAENRALLGKFGKRAKRALSLGTSDDEKKSKTKADGQVGKDYRLRVMKKKGGRVLVRDLFGREGWADEKDLY